MCPPWIEGAHAGAPLQEETFLTFMSATWYKLILTNIFVPKFNLGKIDHGKLYDARGLVLRPVL